MVVCETNSHSIHGWNLEMFLKKLWIRIEENDLFKATEATLEEKFVS